MVFVAIELVIFRGLCKAKDVNFIVGESGVVEQVNIIDTLKGFEIALVLFRIPMALAGENVVMFGVAAIEIVIAKAE